MKTENSKLYLQILDEYLNGEGIDFAKHGMNRADIVDMMLFYSRTLKDDVFRLIIQYVLTDSIFS